MNAITSKQGFTVEELTNYLKSYPPKAIVVLSSDEEGNEFGILGRIEQDSTKVIVLWPISGTVE